MATLCPASSSKDLYNSNQTTPAGMCMSTFIEYALFENSRSPDAIIPAAWVASIIVCLTVLWLHWELYCETKIVAKK